MLRERACIAEGFGGLALAHSQPEVRDGASSFFWASSLLELIRGG
jgi:hypothetical protein